MGIPVAEIHDRGTDGVPHSVRLGGPQPSTVAQVLNKAASKGVIHKNQAANKKSALALAVNKL